MPFHRGAGKTAEDSKQQPSYAIGSGQWAREGLVLVLGEPDRAPGLGLGAGGGPDERLQQGGDGGSQVGVEVVRHRIHVQVGEEAVHGLPQETELPRVGPGATAGSQHRQHLRTGVVEAEHQAVATGAERLQQIEQTRHAAEIGAGPGAAVKQVRTRPAA